MNKRFFPLFAGLLILTSVSFPLMAADLSVDYLEGDLDYRQGRDTWTAVDIGDSIPQGSSLRLSDRGFAELSMDERTVTLTRDGLYEAEDLFGAEAEQANFREVLGSKFAALLGRGKAEDSSTVAATRQSDKSQVEDTMAWEDDSVDFLSEGKAYFAEGSYAEALEEFEEGSVWETGAVQRECRFRMGICQQTLGNRREARETLTGIRPQAADPYLGEYAILMGTLYQESMEYDEADKVLAMYLEAHPSGEDAQAVWLLSAYSFLGQGREAEAKQSARQAVNKGADTDLGRAAQELLDS